MAYNIRKLTVADEGQLMSFLDTVFHIRNRDKISLVHWKYFHTAVKERVQYGAFDGDHLIAHYANIPLSLRYHKTVLPAMLCIDMSTHPSYRGQGLISRLSEATYRDISNSSRVLSLGFSNDEGVKVDLHSVGYGYHVVGAFQSYGLMAMYFPQHVELTNVTTFEAVSYHIPEGLISIDKSKEYVIWRYQDHPGIPYLIYSVKKEHRQVGYVVLRSSQFRIDIVDIILEDMQENAVREVIQAVQNLAFHERKQLVVICMLENDYWKRVMKGCLGLKKPTSKAYYLTVRVHKSEIIGSDIYDDQSWICMSGDIL